MQDWSSNLGAGLGTIQSTGLLFTMLLAVAACAPPTHGVKVEPPSCPALTPPPLVFPTGKETRFGHDQWPIGLHRIREPVAAEVSAVVIYLTGGPGIRPTGPDVQRHLDRVYGGLDALVLSVEYSGSNGAFPDINHRLEVHKLPALGCDARVIADLLTTLKRTHPDVPIVVEGSSFSALPVMLAASASLDEKDQLVLISPWTHFRSAPEMFSDPRSIITAGGQVSRGDGAARQAYERQARMLYGIDESFERDVGRDWMSEARSKINLAGTRTLVFFGEWETRVDLAEAQEFFSRVAPSADVRILSKNYHETVRADPRLRETIREALAGKRNTL